MMSNDKAIAVEIYGMRYVLADGQIAPQRQLATQAEVQAIDRKLDLLIEKVNGINGRFDDMKFYVSLAFGVLAVIVAFVGLSPIISKLVQKIELTDEQLDSRIDRAVTKALQAKG